MRKTATTQEFKVIGHATRFKPRPKESIKDFYKQIYPYFKRMSPKAGQSFFNQLRPDEIDDYDGEIYGIWTESSQRAMLDYHSQRDPEHTRGKILFDFTQNFIEYLSRYNIAARSKIRNFYEFKPDKDAAELPLATLERVSLFDNRLNKTATPIDKYQSLLSNAYPQLTFEIIQHISDSSGRPVLIIQDYNKEDFNDDGILVGKQDPYQVIYNNSNYLGVPKQSINVNTNDAQDTLRDKYLAYDLLSLEKDKQARFDLRFNVCLNQLYLKNLIINPYQVLGYLPSLANENATLLQYAFVRKKTYDGSTYRTLVYIENGELVFADLRNPEERSKLHILLEKYGLEWEDDVIAPFNSQIFKTG